MKSNSKYYESEEPIILWFNGFYYKGFENGLAYLRWFGTQDMRDYFAVRLEFSFPFGE